MKVFNLTDIETPELKQRGLSQQSIAVGDKLLAPGASDDIDDATLARVRPELQRMVALKTVALGELPAEYKVAKEKAKKPERHERHEPAAEVANEKEAPKRGGR